MSKRIEDIRLVVEVMHNWRQKAERAAPMKCGKDEIWEGVVEIFSLTGHPNAKLCYAWNFADDDAEPHYVAVLELPPVSSPHTAVRAAIASGQKK